MAIQLSNTSSNLFPKTNSTDILYKVSELLPNMYLVNSDTYIKLNEYIEKLKLAIENNTKLSKNISDILTTYENRKNAIQNEYQIYLDLKNSFNYILIEYEKSKDNIIVYYNNKYSELKKSKIDTIISDDSTRLENLITEQYTKSVNNYNTRKKQIPSMWIEEEENLAKLLENLYDDVDLIKESGLE